MKIKYLQIVVLSLITTQIFAQISLDGEFRPRTEFRNGYQNLNPSNADAALFTSQRTRLNTKFEADKYSFFVSLQDIRVWGDVSQLNTSDKNSVAIHEAWGLINFDNISLKAGRQEIIYDDHRIFGDVGWTQQARSHDALLLKFGKTFKLDIGFAFNQNGEANEGNFYTVSNNYKAIQYAWYHKQWNNLAASFLFLNNGLQYIDNANATNNDTRYSQTLGTHLKYKFSEALNSTANVYYQKGKDVVNRDLNAFLVGLDLNYKTASILNLGLGFEVQSGNAYNGNISENKAFTPFYGTNHKFNGYMDYFYVGNHINSTGLVDIYAKIGAKLNDKSNITLTTHNFKSYAEIANGVKKQLGIELDLVYNYSYTKEISISAGYSQMFEDEGLQVLRNNFDGNTNNWAWVMLILKPTLFSSK